MNGTTTYQVNATERHSLTVSQLSSLVKVRLTTLVVLTALGAYFVASGLSMSLVDFLLLGIGGFGITAASNAINQVLEHQHDALMNRTKNRPLPSGEMKISMAVLIAGALCVIGITALATFNSLTAFFGMLAFVLYAFVYTPLKRYSRAAVFVGAIAGAMPMLIGVVAFDGTISLFALFLFMVQFAWQFPHFWAIAHLGFEDYDRAGFSFIPKTSDNNVDHSIATSSLIYCIVLLVVVGLMFALGMVATAGAISLSILSIWFLYNAVVFWRSFDTASARRLMLSSLAYIPLFLLLLILDIYIYQSWMQ